MALSRYIRSILIVLYFNVKLSNGNLSVFNQAVIERLHDVKSHAGLDDKEFHEFLVHKAVHGKDDLIDRREGLNISCSFNVTECSLFLEENCLSSSTLTSLGTPEYSLSDWFPSVVYQLVQSKCKRSRTKKYTVPSSAQAWGYGIGFVTLICIVSNVGAFFTPIMDHRYFQRVLLYCVALAVGTLASTGLLVLIPESMHLTEKESPVPDYHLKMATVLGGLYFFYIAEKFLKLWFNRSKDVKAEEDELESISSKHAVDVERNGDVTEKEKEIKTVERSKSVIVRTNKISTVALMIMIGDALHNFVDGISIGAAFTENTFLGISVSLAIICEELPHELGDIAILLHSGLTMKRSLFYNFLAATTCYIGLVIGILLGENTDANMWIFAIAGGMFVYISLVDMIPEMGDQVRHVVENGIESVWTALFIQNLGLLSGFVIIFILVLYGGNIEV
ncbi:metal cation symporter ZIP14-like [Mya arenaria]|uniref:metal cation symporter ZIP14-like n=1 Tax=Mya arenaria TaxID=6604 RepID=UPI0022DFB887|nr:metal cation symporter ZIP14-like [Mya arenaria]